MAADQSLPLSFAELHEIDRQTFNKAATILEEARNRLESVDYDLAVRRSQEAFELYMKSLFRFLQRPYPQDHNLKNQIYELTAALGKFQLDRRQIARLVVANSILALWRSPAFYGDEKLNVGGLFDRGEADLAITYASSAQFVCNVVRARVYEQANVKETA